MLDFSRLKWLKKVELDEIRAAFTRGLDASQLAAKYVEIFTAVRKTLRPYELHSDAEPATCEDLQANRQFEAGIVRATATMELDPIPYALWFRMYFTDYMITLLSEIPAYGDEQDPKTVSIIGGELVGARDLTAEGYNQMVQDGRIAEKPFRELTDQLDEWAFAGRRLTSEEILSYWRRYASKLNEEFLEKEETFFEDQYV